MGEDIVIVVQQQLSIYLTMIVRCGGSDIVGPDGISFRVSFGGVLHSFGMTNWIGGMSLTSWINKTKVA